LNNARLVYQIFIKTTPHHRLAVLVCDPFCTALVAVGLTEARGELTATPPKCVS
jgi:hypothetical protein